MAWSQVGNIKGPQGNPGVKGDPGNPGRGVDSASIDGNDRLVITYSDGSTSNLGVVKGAPGQDGKSISYAGQVATYANLPTGLGSADAGKGWLVLADGKLYTWSGTAFPPNTQGTPFKGDKGDAGTPGVDGSPGAQGVRGTKWFVGTGAPGTIADAITGDKYLDTNTGTIYDF